MTQSLAPLLHLPLLLATDGSPSAEVAKSLVLPIAQLLAADPQAAIADSAVLVALTVQPRSSPIQRLRKATPTGSSNAMLPDEEIDLIEAQPTEAESTATPEALSPSEFDLPASPLEIIEAGQQAATAAPEALPTPDLPPALATLRSEWSQSTELAKLPIQLQVKQGRPTSEILSHARSIQAGLIALGCHGTGGARELLLGSVSAAIARYAASHVLIARSLSEDNPPPPTWTHVLLVVTGAQTTQSAIALTRQLLPIGIHRLTILCVQPPLTTHYLFGPFASPTPSWQLMQSLQEAQDAQSQQIIHHAQAAFEGCAVEIETLVQVGEPGALICQVAQQQQANIILLGSDGAATKRNKEEASKLTSALRRSPFRTLRLSSTADYVIHHAPCPVLLCRTSPAGKFTAPTESAPSDTAAPTSSFETR